MSSLVLIAPALATFASVAPPCYLGLLGSSLEAYDEFKAGYEHALPPWGGVLKGLGAACLFVGHFTLAAHKDRLARCDFCYLVGAGSISLSSGGATDWPAFGGTWSRQQQLLHINSLSHTNTQ